MAAKDASVNLPETEEKAKNKCLACMKQNFVTLGSIAGVVLGVILGIVLKKSRSAKYTARETMYISYFGDLFLRMLKSLIIPLIASSLVSAVANMDLSLSGKIATRAVAYYLTTTFASVVMGIILAASIRPGAGQSLGKEETGSVLQRNITTTDTLLDLVKNMFPPNIVQACLFQTQTILKPPKNNTEEKDLYKWNVSEGLTASTNILGLVVVSLVVGVALAQLGEKAATLTDLFNNVMSLSMKVVSWVITFSPFGVLFLIAAKVVEMDNMAAVLAQLGKYFGTVLAGLLFQGIIFLPLLYLLLAKKNPFVFLGNLLPAIITGFGTASSSATLPVTIRCLEEKNGIDSRVARFCLPIGCAINMDGTALYEAVAAIFIAQVRQVDLSLGTYIAISLTATAASIGAAGIPQAGLVTLVMVLDTVGLPPEDVSLILTLDWLLDRFRTAINIVGDAFGAGVVHHRSKKELEQLGG